MLRKGYIKSLEIITSDDDSFTGNFPYINSMWFCDLGCSWNLFYGNAKAAMMSKSPDASLITDSFLLKQIFAKRELSVSEHSVAQRHFHALQMIANGSETTIVL